MSIINEALKRAEREHAHVPLGMARRQAFVGARQRWMPMIVGLIGFIGLSGFIGWQLNHLNEPNTRHPPQGGLLELKHPSQAGADDVTGAPARLVQDRSPLASMALPRSSMADKGRYFANRSPQEFPSLLKGEGSGGGAPVGEGQGASKMQLPSEPHGAAGIAFQKAVQAESQGAWQVAIRYYQEAITLNPNLRQAYNNLGHLYARQNLLPAAIEQFQAALAVAPDYAIARNNLGSTYLMLGREAMAIQEFLAAIRLDERYVSPYYNLGSLYARRGDIDQAISFLTKAIAMEPAVLTWLRQDADFDRIRASRAFQRLYTRVR